MKSILIIAVPGIGDVLLSTPLISAVRARWPQAELHVMLRHAAAGVLEGNPDVDAVIGMSPRAGFVETSRLLLPRFRHYDLIISNATSDRTTFYSLLLGRRRVSAVPASGQAWKRWLSHACVPAAEDDGHIMARMRDLGRAAGLEVGYDVINPHSPDSCEVIARHLGEGWQRAPYAVIHPSASLPAKHWHRHGWHSVVDCLRTAGLRVVVTGGPGESERRYVEQELALGSELADCVVGSLRLADIAELVARSTIYVGVDTLVSHMAAAAGVPTVVLFGPSNPLQWAPWPRGYGAEESPYGRSASQRVGNVCVLRHETGSLDALAESEVTAAIGSMLEDSMRESPA